MIYHIVAIAKNRVIGKDNKLPWHFRSDLQHFKKLTMGETVLMGRKTFESIGKPLPGRENFVLTSQNLKPIEGVHYFKTVQEALAQVKTRNCFIIGGASVYEATLGLIDGVYLTQIDADYEGDAFYPELSARFKIEGATEILQENPRLTVRFYQPR